MMVLSYRAHPAVTKAAFVAEMEAHAAADRIQAGNYWSDGTGCAIGCGVQSIIALEGVKMDHGDHAAYAEALGIPLWLSHVQDTLFENFSCPRQRLFPVQFARALPDGADLSGLYADWMPWMLYEIVLPAVKDNTVMRSVINRVADGVASDWTKDNQTAARESAWAAARDAAKIATRAAASAAAWAAANDGAWAAVGAAVDSTADTDTYVKIADKLLELMAACPVLAT